MAVYEMVVSEMLVTEMLWYYQKFLNNGEDFIFLTIL